MPFLTLLDPRAKIKGSRDTLGFQILWTHLGRQVIQNLTTVITFVRGFTALLVGLYFAEQRKTDEINFSNLFLKFEQLAGYNHITGKNGTAAEQIGENEILDIRRVKKNLQENSAKVRISPHQDHQILSNQRIRGLWGCFIPSPPAAASS